MEGAIRKALKESLGEYVKRGLEKCDVTSFPIVLRNLELNEKKVQEIWDEDKDSALQLTKGVIGSVKVEPGWMGNIEVQATNIQLSFSFSATQALKNKMKPDPVDIDTPGGHYGGGHAPIPQGPSAPPPNCPPRFCSAHDSSDKRVKGDPVSRDCEHCGITLTSSYEGFKLCPPCSEKLQKCMICGSHAPGHTCVEPAPPPPQGPPNCPPRGQNPRQNGGNSKQGSFVPPPPPPACQDPWDRQQPSTSRSMQLGINDSMFLPASANADSMFLPVNQSQYENPQQHFETRLPPQGAMGQFPPGPPPRGPGHQHWGGRMPPNAHNRGRQEDDESFAGFLRFVASDIWKTCHADNRRLDSPEKPTMRYGGA